MEKEHVISEEVLNESKVELDKGNQWVAYNSINYFLEKGDVYFFPSKDEADIFSDDNISEYDLFDVIRAENVDELVRQVVYGEAVPRHLSLRDLEVLFQSFDRNTATYDPLHDTIEASKEQEKDDLARMESLIDEWEQLYHKDPEAPLKLAADHWEGHPMEVYKNDFLTVQFELMIEKNLDYLKTNVRNHGFGDELGAMIEAELKKGASEFTIAHKTEVNKLEMESTLYFGKSDKSDLYFFNKYDTRLKNEKDETMAQTFYINHGWGVTLKEAYNLLNGRAIEKELVRKLTPEESVKFKDELKLAPEERGLAKNWEKPPTYKAWIQLDFSAKDQHGNYERKQYHQNYGYDLKEALSYYPIKEMQQNDTAQNLVRSLQRGNVQMVTVQGVAGDVRVFIEANPQYKSINVYDNKMMRVNQDKREELMKKPEIGASASREVGKETAKEVSKDNAKETSKEVSKDKSQSLGAEGQDGKKSRVKKPAGEDKGLVQKNRTSSKKGLSM